MRTHALALLLLLLATPVALAQEWPQGAYSPFPHSPIRIHLDLVNATGEAEGFAAEVRAAMTYWETGGNGALSFSVAFEEVSSRDDADIILWLRDAAHVSDVCGNSDSALGCARPFERPVPVEVLIGQGGGTYRAFRAVREVTQHELGHALGLPHSTTPGDIMAPHASSRALTAWRPGDAERILLGTGVLLALLAGAGAWWAHAARADLRSRAFPPLAPTCPEDGGPHALERFEASVLGRREACEVCERCRQGRWVGRRATPR